MILGIALNSFVLADDDRDSGDSSGNGREGDDSLKSPEAEDEEEKDDKADGEDEEEIESIEKREFIDESGNRIEIETKIKFEDGEREIKIKKKIIDINGNEREIEIEIEVEVEDGIIKRKIKFKDEFEGIFEAKTELKIEEEILSGEVNETIIKAILSDGNETEIKIMPDRIAEIAIEKLKTLNFTIELKEKEHKNVPRVVYNVETNKNGKFIGIFKLKLKIEAQIDPETGELLGIAKPWWAFLVSGEDTAQIEPATPPQNETGNMTPPGIPAV